MRKGQRWLVLELAAAPDAARVCSGCGRSDLPIHDAVKRRIRDLPVFEDPVELVLPRLRLACPACGPKLERLEWLDAHSRLTRRLADSVARLCTVTSVLHAARWFGLNCHVVAKYGREVIDRVRVDQGDQADGLRLPR